MKLPGLLRGTTLGDVLGALHRAGLHGVLELVEERAAGRVHRISLRGGLVDGIETPARVLRLGEILVRRGIIDGTLSWHAVERRAACTARRFGELLVEAGLADAAAVRAALRDQQVARLDRLFEIPDARLFFRVARAAGGASGVLLTPEQFLHGRPRARERSEAAGQRGEGPAAGRRRGASTESAPGRRRDPVRRRALAVLGLPEGAGELAVRKAFRRLAAAAHPDRHPAASAAERAALVRRFAELSAAYHTLVA